MPGFGAYKQRFSRVETDIGELKRNVVVLKQDMAEVKRDLFLMKRMMGFLLAFQIAIFIKLFLH